MMHALRSIVLLWPRSNKKSQTLINISVWQPKLKVGSQTSLSGFDNFTGFDAAGTDFHTSVTSAGQLHPDRLKIRIEPSSGFIVCV